MQHRPALPKWTTSKGYRVAVSIVFGLLGFAVNFIDIELFSSPFFKINILAGLLFPLLITLAWGWRYGLLSALAGGTQSMWALWYSDGYGFLYAVPVFTAWIVWHGYWADRRRQIAAPRWFHAPFAVEVPFRLVSELGFYTVFRRLVSFNPPPWDPSIVWDAVPLSWVNTVAAKHTITAYILLLVAYVLLNLGPVRASFGLRPRPADRQVNVIYAVAILTGVGIWAFDSVVSYVAFNPDAHTLAEIAFLDVDPYHFFMRNLFIILSLIAGALVAGYTARRHQLQQALRSESERLDRVMETSPVGITVVDAKGQITYANAKAEALLRLSRGELSDLPYNAPALQICDFGGRPFPEERLPFNIVRETQKPVTSIQHAIEHRDGHRTFLSINAAPLLSPEGHFEGLVASMEDMTARKEAQEALRLSESRYRSVYNTAPLAFVVWDLETRVMDWNRQAEALFGWTREEVLGLNFFDFLIPPSARPQVEDTVASLITDDFVTHAVNENVTKDGEIVICEWNNAILHDAEGKIIGAISLGLDITDRVQAEQELQAHRRHLEELVAERTAQLQARTKELEDFSYSVSHDLKAPLRGIDGYSHLLLMDYADRLDEEGVTFLRNVRKAVTRMHQLIDDLLAYSRLERRDMAYSEIDLHQLIDAFLHALEPEIAGRGIQVTVDLPFSTIHGDADSFGQSLRNLLDNAIKFTSKTPEPLIVIGGEEHDAYQLLYVQDNGIGFDMRYHDKIFQIFQRLHRSDDYPGTGVGLAIVRKAMERIGGRAWAESAPGKGATFYLEIPKPGL